MQNTDRIIVPLDVPSLTEAIALVEKLPQASFWKVGLQLFVSAGPEILKFLKEQQKRIFLDLKFHDIPNTVAGAVDAAAQYQIDLLTIHATAGRAALTSAVKAISAETYRPKLLAITLLTSINSRELAMDLQIPLELSEYALKMALLAQETGLDGAVCSPLEAGQLRQVCGNNFLLVCPGVRPIWSVTQDQSRVMTPAQALKAGADYLVIGRPITAAPDCVAAWNKICDELA